MSRKSKISNSKRYETFELTPINKSQQNESKSVNIQFYTFNGMSKDSKPIFEQKWPKFNNDGLYFTPAFVIPQDLRVLSLVHDTLKDQHLKNVKINEEPSRNIQMCSMVMPKKGGEHYCGVCKTNYPLFIQHINSQSHKKNSLNSTYTKCIYDFIGYFFPRNMPKVVKNSSKIQFSNIDIQHSQESNVSISPIPPNVQFSKTLSQFNQRTIQQTPIQKKRIIQ